MAVSRRAKPDRADINSPRRKRTDSHIGATDVVQIAVSQYERRQAVDALPPEEWFEQVLHRIGRAAIDQQILARTGRVCGIKREEQHLKFATGGKVKQRRMSGGKWLVRMRWSDNRKLTEVPDHCLNMRALCL